MCFKSDDSYFPSLFLPVFAFLIALTSHLLENKDKTSSVKMIHLSVFVSHCLSLSTFWSLSFAALFISSLGICPLLMRADKRLFKRQRSPWVSMRSLEDNAPAELHLTLPH